MRVRAKVGRDNKLTCDKEYFVLGLDSKYFRILDDSEIPALYPRRAFNVIDDNVPENWAWRRVDQDEFYADPLELSEPGFYERYFDHDDDAIRTFNESIKKMGIKEGKEKVSGTDITEMGV